MPQQLNADGSLYDPRQPIGDSSGYQHPQDTNLLNIHKAMQYNTDGEPEIRVTLGQTVSNADWYLQVAIGNITGATAVFKAGYNSAIGATEESLWGGSVIYPWSAWDTPGTLSCVSDSASDTGQLHIIGLRSSDWTQVEEVVTLTGTTPVVTINSFVRINNLHYFHTASNVGALSVSRNGTVVGYIEAGLGQGQMAQYTVPAGHTAYILTGQANIGKGNDGTGKFKYRIYGSNFQTAMVFLLYQSTFSYDFKAPLVLPEKSDLDVTMIASNANTPTSCAYSMIIINNSVI